MSTEKEKQQARLLRLAKKLTPGCEVHFHLKGMPDAIEMRVDDSQTGTTLYTSRQSWSVNQIKDKRDGELQQLLRAWRDGKS